MNFAKYLTEAVKFTHPEDDWEKAEEADQIMRMVGIRPDSTKELSIIAIDNDTVVGGLYTSWHPGEEYEGHRTEEFSFDVGVHPKYQGFSMIGPRLVDYGMQTYSQDRHAYGDYTYIKLRVVNPKLAEYLQRKYKFDDAYTTSGETFLTKY